MIQDKRIRLAAIAIALALIVVFTFRNPSSWFDTSEHTNRTILAVVFGASLVLPPLWFLWEWHRFRGDKDEFERLKHGQELAKNFWLAVSVALGLALGFKTFGG